MYLSFHTSPVNASLNALVSLMSFLKSLKKLNFALFDSVEGDDSVPVDCINIHRTKIGPVMDPLKDPNDLVCMKDLSMCIFCNMQSRACRLLTARLREPGGNGYGRSDTTITCIFGVDIVVAGSN